MPMNQFKESIARSAETRARANAHERARYQRARDAGKCTECGNPSEYSVCRSCADHKKLQAYLRGQGVKAPRKAPEHRGYHGWFVSHRHAKTDASNSENESQEVNP